MIYCPVCKIKINFEIPKEDIYYDCSNCQSALLFSKGTCQVIHAETTNIENIKDQTQSQDLEPLKEEAVQQESGGEQKEQQEEPEAFEQKTKKSLLTKKPIEEEEEQINSQDSLKELTEEKEDNLEKIISAEQNRKGEENFYPTENTQVPELSPETKEEEEEEEEEEQNTPYNENMSSDNQEENFIEEIDSNRLQTEDNKILDSKKDKEDFLDVSEFGKNPEKNSKSPYLYDLTLSGINSQNLKKEVQAVLEDSFLNLPEEISSTLKKTIDQGEVKISKISPIQTHIIVSSLMGLGLNIYWKQYHIADD
ncbi:MAG: hypothetical protein OXC37_01780 [Bdellovibrionaceae bacterium]|nr:hypothetical protein [Pseudobdellovibrionaceae bacterium]